VNDVSIAGLREETHHDPQTERRELWDPLDSFRSGNHLAPDLEVSVL
jgi:hypothetical protein